MEAKHEYSRVFFSSQTRRRVYSHGNIYKEIRQVNLAYSVVIKNYRLSCAQFPQTNLFTASMDINLFHKQWLLHRKKAPMIFNQNGRRQESVCLTFCPSFYLHTIKQGIFALFLPFEHFCHLVTFGFKTNCVFYTKHKKSLISSYVLILPAILHIMKRSYLGMQLLLSLLNPITVIVFTSIDSFDAVSYIIYRKGPTCCFWC